MAVKWESFLNQSSIHIEYGASICPMYIWILYEITMVKLFNLVFIMWVAVGNSKITDELMMMIINTRHRSSSRRNWKLRIWNSISPASYTWFPYTFDIDLFIKFRRPHTPKFTSFPIYSQFSIYIYIINENNTGLYNIEEIFVQCQRRYNKRINWKKDYLCPNCFQLSITFKLKGKIFAV